MRPVRNETEYYGCYKRRIPRLADKGLHTFTHHIHQYLLIRAATPMETSISHTSSTDMRPPQGQIKGWAIRAAALDATTSLELSEIRCQ